VSLLEHDRADDPGFVDEAGEVFHQYFYEIEIFTSPARAAVKRALAGDHHGDAQRP